MNWAISLTADQKVGHCDSYCLKLEKGSTSEACWNNSSHDSKWLQSTLDHTGPAIATLLLLPPGFAPVPREH